MASVSKAQIRASLAEKYKIADDSTIFVFGFRIAFGGERSTGFATVYETLEDALENEPKFRLVRNEITEAATNASRKIRRELKNKRKRLIATQKDKGKKKRKTADDE
jgi:small subunit ribosomal protein S24e